MRIVLSLACFIGMAYYSAAQPALPPGLGGEAKSESTPALPPGLGGSTTTETAPALPPGLGGETTSEETEEEKALTFPLELHGFTELRGGLRLQNDSAHSKDATIGEGRLQVNTEYAWEHAVFEATGDLVGDGVLEEADFDLRQARLTFSISDQLDVRLGRQILTWGTGDLLFINDLFPKDWQSFLIGRDVEYLKAPSDAVKVGWYSSAMNLELVYTPKFNADRHITGQRISYWNPLKGDFSGNYDPLQTNKPDDWFDEDEIALRAYRNLGGYEVALYGYHGFWKSPGGMDLSMPTPTGVFPRLNVYGASIRGTLGKGVFNVETGYYDSRDDSNGRDPLVNNSEYRFLVGYEQEVGKDFTAAVQWYWEYMMDYSAYRDTLPPGMNARDRNRHLFTLRLTKLLMNQNLTLSWFSFYSPTDNDAFLLPSVKYKINDDWSVDGGLHIFLGEDDHTFFGQFENNSSIYGAIRYAF